MSRDSSRERMELEGTVLVAHGNGIFRVQTEAVEVLATLAGKIRQNNIKILEGDKVVVEITPYDPTRGRIIFRRK